MKRPNHIQYSFYISVIRTFCVAALIGFTQRATHVRCCRSLPYLMCVHRFPVESHPKQNGLHDLATSPHHSRSTLPDFVAVFPDLGGGFGHDGQNCKNMTHAAINWNKKRIKLRERDSQTDRMLLWSDVIIRFVCPSNVNLKMCLHVSVCVCVVCVLHSIVQVGNGKYLCICIQPRCLAVFLGV